MRKREIYKGWTSFDHKLRAFVSTIAPQNKYFLDSLLKIVSDKHTSILGARKDAFVEEENPFEMSSALSGEDPNLNNIEDPEVALTTWRRRSQMQMQSTVLREQLASRNGLQPYLSQGVGQSQADNKS